MKLDNIGSESMRRTVGVQVGEWAAIEWSERKSRCIKSQDEAREAEWTPESKMRQ